MYIEGSKVMRAAAEKGLIEVELFPGADTYEHKAMMAIRRKDPSIYKPLDPKTFELAAESATQRAQEHYFHPTLQPDMAWHWGVELARIVVPKGEIGLLTSIEQVFYDLHGAYYPTSSAYWGAPYSVDSDVSGIIWYLQLEYFAGLQPPRFNVTTIAPITRASLPGYPYPELPEIRGLWYAAQSPLSKTKLIIPGNRMLRFFAIVPPTNNYRWFMSGRLRAYTQITYCPEAAANSRLSY